MTKVEDFSLDEWVVELIEGVVDQVGILGVSLKQTLLEEGEGGDVR